MVIGRRCLIAAILFFGCATLQTPGDISEARLQQTSGGLPTACRFGILGDLTPPSPFICLLTRPSELLSRGDNCVCLLERWRFALQRTPVRAVCGKLPYLMVPIYFNRGAAGLALVKFVPLSWIPARSAEALLNVPAGLNSFSTHANILLFFRLFLYRSAHRAVAL